MTTQSVGFTVWLTGMSGVGKTTLAQYLATRFRALGRSCDLLDGAEVEQLFAKGLGDTKDERNLLVRRLGYAAKLLSRAQGIALVPALSPYRDAREQLRREIGRFVEVLVDCPTEVLMSRDTTGRYKKAMAGDLPHFVGVTDPYEPPNNPEVVIRSDQEAVADAAQKIFQHLLDAGYLTSEEVKLLAGKKLMANRGGKKKPPTKVKAPKSKAANKAAKGPSARRPAKSSGASKVRPAARAAKTAKPSAAGKAKAR